MEVGSVLLNLFFPPRCPICGQLGKSQDICPNCQQSMPWILEGVAPAKGEFFQGCYAPLWYRDEVRASFHRFKFGGKTCYARHYATLMVQCIEDHLEERPHCVIWAPIGRRRRLRRGYDQSQLLAEELAKQLGIPLVKGLEKWRDTKPQSSLTDDSARRANSMGAYRMAKGVDVCGQRILLVDDIITSGSTLSECARILRTAGADSILCVAFARAKK